MAEFNEKLCEEKHKNIDEKIGDVNKKLDSTQDDVKEITKAVIELKGISKMLAEKQNNSRGFGLLVFSSICSPIFVGVVLYLILK